MSDVTIRLPFEAFAQLLAVEVAQRVRKAVVGSGDGNYRLAGSFSPIQCATPLDNETAERLISALQNYIQK